MKRQLAVLFAAAVISGTLSAQKKIVNIPDIPGYVTLKCDFHIHTVFSDGNVWPTYRINEAWKDGLDALAITDHLEIQPKRDYIPTDHNAAWKIASGLAKERNLILVHATEITRSMPPGHLNALFIEDAGPINLADPMQAIEEAVRQGAFMQWNHPGWKSQEPDGIPKLYDIHRELLAKGWINGIEYYNELEYYPLVLDWCSEYGLAVTANSDQHEIISETFVNVHRPMTLVFARERTPESLKEAMMDARTVAYFGDVLAGPEELLRALFEESITVSKPYFENERYKWVEIRNVSDVPFQMANGSPGVASSFTIEANSITTLRIEKSVAGELSWDVSNLKTGSSGLLKVTLKH